MSRFVAIEARANAAILRRLANADVTFSGQSAQACVFDNGYALAAVGPFGMAGAQPRLTLPTAAVPANPVGQACTVAGGSYTVAEHQPDGTGISVLLLEVSA